MNIKAIVVYLDNKEKNIEEFTWLYKTWMLHELYQEYDIVVYGAEEVKEHIPIHVNIIHRLMDPIYKQELFWSSYPFVNSFAMFNTKEERVWIMRYKYILKTDCDVFLTQNLLGLNPDKLHIGFGGYMVDSGDEVAKRLEKISKRLKFKYQHINHVGASLYGKTDLVISLTYSHFLVTKVVLESFGKDEGKWPGWFKGVSSMYAIHLVVNNFCDLLSIKLNVLDEFCGNGIIGKDTYHIHAWHYGGYFSKHAWFKGKYKKLEVDKIPEKANEYCHWVVSNSLDNMLKIKNSI